MNTAEQAFYAHLTNTTSLDYIIKEGFSLDVVRDVIPTEIGRKITEWAIQYYFDSGRIVAPSKEAIMMAWKDQLVPLDIEIIDDVETDSIQWSVQQLRNNYADWQAGEFAKEFSKAVRNADGPDRAGVVLEHSQLLHLLSQSLIPRSNEMDLEDGLKDALARYEEIVLKGSAVQGLTIGVPEIDNYTLGTHPGEITVAATTSGGGKSWLAIKAMLSEFERGRKPILYTLENTLEMTFDRIACLHCKVDYEHWQQGKCDEGDIIRVKSFIENLQDSANKPLIIRPDSTEATGAAMIRRAFIEEADSVIIDQLSHIQPVAKSRARERNQVVAEIVRDLGQLIGNSGSKIPLLLLHQINRKGREDARKVGRYLMDHLGEATQVENDATLVLGIYQSPDAVLAERATIQTLKARRIKPKDWEVSWRPAVGDVRFLREANSTND